MIVLTYGVGTAGRRSVAAALIALAAAALFLAPARSARADDGAPVAIISEFLASNNGSYFDEDGDPSDWLEIANLTGGALDLSGWYLTDDADDLTQWQFPTTTTLAPGARLVVFASSKDRRIPDQPLHTNFNLSRDGEYLGLIRPDGVTAEHDYSPAYPEQHPDVSFGVGAARSLLAEAQPRWQVPDGPDDGGAVWRGQALDDGAWDRGPFGVGFERGALSDVSLVSWWRFDGDLQDETANRNDGDNRGTSFSSSVPATLGEGQSLRFDGANAVVRLENDPSLEALTTEVSIAAWVRLDNVSGRKRILGVRPGWGFGIDNRGLIFTTYGIRDYVIDADLEPGVWTHVAAVFNATRGVTFYIDGASIGESLFSGASNTPNGDWFFGALDGSMEYFGGLMDDVALWQGQLAPAQIAQLAAGGRADAFDRGYFSLIRSSVDEAMAAQSATSLRLRAPFHLVDADGVEALTLSMRYDDGFVAWINGVEVARANAPETLDWDSRALEDRSDELGRQSEDWDVLAARDALTPGWNVLAIQGLSVAADAERFLIDAALTVRFSSGAGMYFDTPTPGQDNGPGFPGFAQTPRSSVERGLYDQPFQVVLYSATAGAEIRYTLDGSEPAQDNGEWFEGVLTIDRTTTLRAAAFLPGHRPSAPATWTWLFPSDVVRQSPGGETPSGGWPDQPVNNQVFDYGMDPRIVDHPGYGPQLVPALQAIPSMSIVTDLHNLIDPARGIYVNASQKGRAWERPMSLELLHADGAEGFQVGAGLRIRGGFSRHPGNPKHSFRLFFRSEYGPSQLEYPLFEDEGVSVFDKFDLRTAQNYAWSNSSFNDATRNSFLRDVFSRDAQGALGDPYTRSRYYHLYLNGQYWGLFQTQERSESYFAHSYMGGERADYDIIKSTAVVDGTNETWRHLWQLAVDGFETDAKYFAAQGRNPDGSENPDLDVYVDVDNLIQFLLVCFYTGNRDCPLSLGGSGPNNFSAIRSRTQREGFQYFTHDNEHSMLGLHDSIMGETNVGSTFDRFNPIWLSQRLMAHPDYVARFGDLVHQHLTGDGLLTPAGADALLMRRARVVESVIVAESARWGDQHEPVPYTRTDWEKELRWLRETYIPVRTDIVLDQLRNRGLYPTVAAPVFSAHGGQVAPGYALTIANPNGEGLLYVGLHGADPRAPGGGLALDADLYSGPIAIDGPTLVSARARVGSEWSALTQAWFQTAATATAGKLAVTEIHYHPPAPTEAEVALGFTDANAFEFLELRNVTSSETLDLSGLAFDEGIAFDFSSSNTLTQTLAPGDYVVVVENREAFRLRYGDGPPVAGAYDGRLSNSGERLRLVNGRGEAVFDFAYGVSAPWPQRANGLGSSLERVDVSAPPGEAASWRASAEWGGTPGALGRGPAADVVVNEIVSRSSRPGGDAIELLNVTDGPIDMSGWLLSDNIAIPDKFTFPAGAILPAGGRMVLDEGDFNVSIGANRPFALSGAGEAVVVMESDAAGRPARFVDHVTFGPSRFNESFGRWPDGQGELFPMARMALGAPNAGPRRAEVIVSEIHYRPAPVDGRDMAFIELANPGPSPQDLTGWRLAGDVDFPFPDGFALPPRGVATVLSFDPDHPALTDLTAQFRRRHDLDESALLLGPWQGTLAGAATPLMLEGPEYAGDANPLALRCLVDWVGFAPSLPWPLSANGQGPSLHRQAPWLYGDQTDSWLTDDPQPGRYPFPTPEATTWVVY